MHVSYRSCPRSSRRGMASPSHPRIGRISSRQSRDQSSRSRPEGNWNLLVQFIVFRDLSERETELKGSDGSWECDFDADRFGARSDPSICGMLVEGYWKTGRHLGGELSNLAQDRDLG